MDQNAIFSRNPNHNRNQNLCGLITIYYNSNLKANVNKSSFYYLELFLLIQ